MIEPYSYIKTSHKPKPFPSPRGRGYLHKSIAVPSSIQTPVSNNPCPFPNRDSQNTEEWLLKYISLWEFCRKAASGTRTDPSSSIPGCSPGGWQEPQGRRPSWSWCGSFRLPQGQCSAKLCRWNPGFPGKRCRWLRGRRCWCRGAKPGRKGRIRRAAG